MSTGKVRYVIKCFKEGAYRVGKVVLHAYKEVGSWNYLSKKKINFIEGDPSNFVRRLVKDPSGCDYILVKSEDGKQEILIPMKPSEVKTSTLYPKLAKLRKISILKRQEPPNIEENVVFSHTLISEEFPVKENLFVFEGEVRVPKNAIGLKITTDSGERILLASELPTHSHRQKES